MKKNLDVLYEDNHLIAVYKPAGVLVQGDKSGDESLMELVKNYVKEKYQKPGNVFLGLIHRLDRNVAGVVLFAKTSKGASRLSEQFRNHTVEKIYHAVVAGVPKEKKAMLVHFVTKNEKHNVTSVSDKQTADSQRAELSYEVVKTYNRHALLKIILGTGRSHQIRAQMAAIGHPLVGDVKYGSKEKLPNDAIALVASSLSFETATTSEPITVSAPLPSYIEDLLT